MRKSSLRLLTGATALATSLSLVACGGGDSASNVQYDDTVKVGILHSLTGTMAISESTLVDTEKMAIDEINAAGGVTVDGKKYKIDYIVEDGASDWPTFAEKSKKLIDQDKVPVVFGGWTSASRKAMLPVYESKDAFLYYPIQYEGQECSKNIFYTARHRVHVQEVACRRQALLPGGIGLRLPPHLQHHHQAAAQVAGRQGCG